VLALLTLVTCLIVPRPALAAAERNVLVLYSNGRLLPAIVEGDRGLVEGFAARPDLDVVLATEFLDAPRFKGADYEQAFVTYLRQKYASHPPDLLIVGGELALDFVLRNRQSLFPTMPVVHVSVPAAYLKAIPALPADVVGSPIEHDFAGTVEQALRWHPGARRLVVVTGSSSWDLEWEASLRAQAKAWAARLGLVFLAGLPTDELARRLRELPRDAIIFTPGYFSDGAGRAFVPRESARLIAAAAPVPVYAPFSSFIGTGVVGGRMADYAEMGHVAAATAIRLLDGASAASLTPLPAMASPVQVDWRQLQRWNIDPAAIPADAIVHFKEPSFWEAYRHWVLAAAAVIALQAGLIAALLAERRRRRLTAAALARSEQHMSLAARAARLSMWTLDAGPTNSGRAALGADPLADFSDTLARIHPLDRDRVDRALRRALADGDEFDVEYRIEGIDRDWRWQAARGRGDGRGDGRSDGRGDADPDPGHSPRLLGVAIDITERKRAELQAEQDRSALQHMTRVSLLGQLSASIAHQLNQPLASILGNAEAAQTMLGREPLDLPELRDICQDIIDEDHRAAAVIRRLGALFKRGEPSLAPLDLNELVRDTLEMVRTNLLTRHVAVRQHLAPDLPLLDGDRVQLQQLLLNLIVNAADAMESLPLAERVLTVSTGLRGTELSLCVADRGPGVTLDSADKLFEPFWSTKAGGMGIGLAVCRSIAVAHRGSLGVKNGVETGAEFCALLPTGGHSAADWP
jgi:signal transduction histidine kinase